MVHSAYCDLKATLETTCRDMVLQCLTPDQQVALAQEEESNLFASIQQEARTEYGEAEFSFETHCSN